MSTRETICVKCHNSYSGKKEDIFLIPQEKMSSLETICVKCRNSYSGKKRKYFSMSSAESFTQNAKRYNDGVSVD